MRAGANAARYPWLLFLNADTVLDAGWEREADHFMERVDSGARGMPRPPSASRSTTTASLRARSKAWCVCAARLLRLPYGDQGLLIAAPPTTRSAAIVPCRLMEDVDLVRRVGMRR